MQRRDIIMLGVLLGITAALLALLIFNTSITCPAGSVPVLGTNSRVVCVIGVEP